MPLKINDIAYYLPDTRISKADLAAMHPDWDVDRIEQKTGVSVRHVLAPGQTMLDISVAASKKLFERNPGLREKVDGIIFCATCSDLISPKNSYLLHKELHLQHHVFCLDIGMACSGFVYSLAVARGLIATGVATNVIIVTADILSKHILAKSCKPLCSDGAAATWVRGSDSSGGMVDADFGALGKSFDAVYIPSTHNPIPVPADTNTMEPEQMVLDGKRVLTMVGSHVPRQVKKLLKKNRLTKDDIDLYVFHQGSKLMVDTLERLLRLPQEKVFRNYETVGNTSSASIPIALRDALDQGIVQTGDKVLISGFGSGFSWGTAILQI